MGTEGDMWNMLRTQLEIHTWETGLDAKGRMSPRQLQPMGNSCQGRDTGGELHMSSPGAGAHPRTYQPCSR